MPLFKRESTPAPGPSFPLRPMPKPEQKPQAKPAAPELKKLFGEKGYKSQSELRQFARKAPFEPLPGTGRKLGKEERVGLVKELQERAKRAGQFHGVSEQAWRERILPQMRREKYQLHASGRLNEEKALERKIQQYERWIKGA